MRRGGRQTTKQPQGSRHEHIFQDSLGAGCTQHHGDNLSLFDYRANTKGAGKDVNTSLLLSYDTCPRELSKAAHSCLDIHNSGQVTEFLNFFSNKISPSGMT